jgi:hypothetical protein
MTRQILVTKPGKYADITPSQYFSEICPAPAFTNSLIKLLIEETPKDAAYTHPAIGQPPEEVIATMVKRRGDVTHQLALGKGRGYAVGQWNAWRTDEAKAFKQAAVDAGVTPILQHEIEDASNMAAILKENIATTLRDIGAERGIPIPDGGFSYETEVVFACTFEIDGQEIWARIMVDVWCEDLLVALDPKCTPYLTDKHAPAHIGNMGWDTQAALYPRVIETINPEWAGRVVFADLMVKPKPPYTSRTVSIPESWKTVANMDIDVAMRIFAKCIREDNWPGYAPGIHYMQQPSWAQKLALERQMEEGEGE